MAHATLSGLSNEEQKDLLKILNLKYAHFLKDRFFDLKIWVEKGISHVDLAILNQSNSYHYPISARMDLETTKMVQKDTELFILDYLDYYLEDFFNGDEEIYLPIDWATFSWEGQDIQLKGQKRNLLLEKKADELLGNEI